jgi:hypothetical protein
MNTVPKSLSAVPWWLVLLQGILSILVGMMLLTTPGSAMIVLVRLLGWYWLIKGIFSLTAIFHPEAKSHRGWLIFSSLISIVAGFAVLDHPLISAVFVPAVLVTFVGIAGLLIGFNDLFAFFRGAGWGNGPARHHQHPSRRRRSLPVNCAPQRFPSSLAALPPKATKRRSRVTVSKEASGLLLSPFDQKKDTGGNRQSGDDKLELAERDSEDSDHPDENQVDREEEHAEILFHDWLSPHVTRDQPRHLEHGHARLAIEDDLQCIIRINLRPLLLILKFILLDIVPEFFG